jgi:broad specificity phosphatase PhoE
MTTFILIRHGEPRYDEVIERGISGMAYNFGKLSANGILQAKARAKDPLLKDAEFIIASPYTRALQTAQIIASELQLEVEVEHDLHEWLPHLNPNEVMDGDAAYEEYMKKHGELLNRTAFNYETYENLKKRVQMVLFKYANYKKVIVVAHGIVMSTMTRFDDVIEYCGVREVTL